MLQEGKLFCSQNLSEFMLHGHDPQLVDFDNQRLSCVCQELKQVLNQVSAVEGIVGDRWGAQGQLSWALGHGEAQKNLLKLKIICRRGLVIVSWA